MQSKAFCQDRPGTSHSYKEIHSRLNLFFLLACIFVVVYGHSSYSGSGHLQNSCFHWVFKVPFWAFTWFKNVNDMHILVELKREINFVRGKKVRLKYTWQHPIEGFSNTPRKYLYLVIYSLSKAGHVKWWPDNVDNCCKCWNYLLSDYCFLLTVLVTVV